MSLTPKKRVLFAHNLRLALLVVFGVISLLAFTLRSPQAAHAATSSTINFQARLESSTGAIAADGNYNVEFKLYSGSSCVPSTGTGCTAVWTEDYLNSATQGVRVANGYLSVSLGSVTAFPTTINWDQPLWISMNIGGTTTGTPSWDGAMLPYLQLTAVPYAFRAGSLATSNSGGTLTSTLSIQAPTGGSQTFQIQDQGGAGTYNILTAPSGSDGYVKLQTSTPGTVQAGSLNINGTAVIGTAVQAPLLQTTDGTGASAAITFRSGNSTTSGNTGNVTIASGNATSGTSGTVSIDDGTFTSGTPAISIGATNARTITIGNTTAATATNIVSGSTGGVNIGSTGTSTASSTTKIGTTTSGTGTQTVTIGSSANAANSLTLEAGNTGKIQIGNSNVAHTIQIGAGGTSTAQIVTIGSSTASSTTTIQGGGGITLSGAVSASNNLTVSGALQSSSLDTASTGGTLTIGSTNATTINIGTASSAVTHIGSEINYSNATGNLGIGSSPVSGTKVNITTGGIGLNINETGGSDILDLQRSGALVAGFTAYGGLTLGSSGGSGAFLVNNGATVDAVDPLSNFSANGPIGTAAATVDSYTAFAINETSTGISLTIPSPTSTTAGRLIYISNTGTQSVNVGGVAIAAGSSLNFMWNGSAWTVVGSAGGGGGVTTVGTYNSQTASANGAVISGSTLYLQAANGSTPGLIDGNTQTFGGNKTFNNNLTVSGVMQVGAAPATAAQLTVLPSASTQRGIVLQAASGQSVDMFDIYNASGIFVSGYDASGNEYLTGILHDNAIDTYSGSALSIGHSGATTTIQGNTAVSLSATTGTTLVCQNGSSYLAACDSSFKAPTATNFIQNQTASAQTGNFYIQTNSTTNVTAKIIGITGQTSDLLDVQDVNGGGLTVGYYGDVIASSALYVNNQHQNSGPALNVTNYLGSTIAANIQGATSQTADLFDLNNSAGQLLTGFDGNGDLTIGSTHATNSTHALLVQNASGNPILNVDTSTGTITFGTGSNTVISTASGGLVASGTVQASSIAGGSTQQFQVDTSGNISTTGTAKVQTATNSTTAFQVQNSSANPVFVVDTSTNRNMVSNSGFETTPYTSGWAGTNASLGSVTANGVYEGNRSLLVNVTTAGGGAQVTGFTSTLTPNSYNFSFEAQNYNNSGTLGVTVTGGSATCTLSATTMSTAGYQRYNCSISSSSTNITAITVTSTGTGQFYLDAVQLSIGGGMQQYNGAGAVQLLGLVDSPVTIQPQGNSTTAFQIQNSAGSSNLFVADTMDNRIGIGTAAPAALFSVGSSSQFQVDINGNFSTTGTGLINTTSATAFSVQAAGASYLNVATSTGTITLGNSTSGNYITISSTGLTAFGTAQHTKTILLTPEYAGAVLDAQSDSSCTSANNGTMTSGYDSTNRMNYYNWTSSQASSQCYDVVVQVPIPADFASWSGTPNIQIKKDSTGTGTYAIQIIPSSGTDANYSSYVSPGTLGTSWGNMATSSLSGTYTAGDYLTIKVRMSSTSGANIQLGNIKLTYNSKF